jgi:hypothetical protein
MLVALSKLKLAASRIGHTRMILFHQQYQRFPQFNPRHCPSIDIHLPDNLTVSIAT